MGSSRTFFGHNQQPITVHVHIILKLACSVFRSERVPSQKYTCPVYLCIQGTVLTTAARPTSTTHPQVNICCHLHICIHVKQAGNAWACKAPHGQRAHRSERATSQKCMPPAVLPRQASSST